VKYITLQTEDFKTVKKYVGKTRNVWQK